MANWKDMFVRGGMQVVTRKAAFPQLVDAPLPDILIKSTVQHGGDVTNQVERKLVTNAAYRDVLPEVWAAHFASVTAAIPSFTWLDQLLRIWSWVLGAVGMVWGGVQQISEEFPDWEALWPLLAGVGVVALRYLVKFILRQLVRRGLEKLRMPNAEDAGKWGE